MQKCVVCGSIYACEGLRTTENSSPILKSVMGAFTVTEIGVHML